MPSAQDRLISGEKTVDENLRIVRAFGNFESTAVLDGKKYLVTAANGWVQVHTHPAGHVVNRTEKEATIAVKDGFITLRRMWIDPEG